MSEFLRGPIPETGIKISEAFQHLQQQLEETPGLNLKVDEDVSEAIARAFRDYKEQIDPDPSFDQLLLAEISAAWMFRDALSEGILRALVRDPRTGCILQLDSEGWFGDAGINHAEPFYHDFIDASDISSPGPQGTEIDGKLQPVFLNKASFEKWLSEIGCPGVETGDRTARSNWPRGYKRADAPLVKKMKQLLDDAIAPSIWNAAVTCAPEAVGGGSLPSKTWRLLGDFVKPTRTNLHVIKTNEKIRATAARRRRDARLALHRCTAIKRRFEKRSNSTGASRFCLVRAMGGDSFFRVGSGRLLEHVPCATQR